MTLLSHTDVHATPCPYCGTDLDIATADDDSGPEPGDISVCLYCANVLLFGADLISYAPSKPELAAKYQAEPGLERQIQRYQQNLRQMMVKRGSLDGR